MPVMISSGDFAWIVPTIVVLVGAIFAAGRWYSNVNADRGMFTGFMQEVRDDFKEVQKDIKEILRRMPPVPVAGASPLRLTEFGEELAKWMAAVEWAEKEADKITLLGGEQPFQLDSVAERYVTEKIDGDTDVLITKCAYEFGTDKEGVRGVLRVVLRDELLKRTGQTLSD